MLLTYILAGVIVASPLSEKHRVWLEDEVAYLITTDEKEVFLELPSDEARDRFISAFWEARDPTPGTSRNEFREEHLERLSEAKRLFRGYGPPGHRSERGRIYIMLGPPRERRSLDHASSLRPIELWFYQVDDPHLPSFFYLLFYRRGGAGDYRLWDPMGEGPAALIATESYNPGFYDRSRVLSIIQGVDTDLYQAVTAPVPGEPSRSPQFAYQQLLAVLEDYSNRSLNPSLANRYRPGEGIVEADYVFRKLEISPLIALLPSQNGVFLHYALDVAPEKLVYNQYETTFYTVLDLTVEIMTPEGQLVYQVQDKREIEVNEKDWAVAKQSPLSLQGRLPVIAGDFRLRILVRSRNARVYDTYETDFRVSPAIETSALLPVRTFRTRHQQDNELAFQVRNTLVVPDPDAIFSTHGNLRAFLVLAPLDVEEDWNIQERIVQGEEVVHELNRTLHRPSGEGASLLNLEIALGEGLRPGDYALELDLGPAGTRVMPFTVEAGTPHLPPLVNSPEELPTAAGHWNLERAKQHLRLQQNQAALASLEEAVRRSPELDTARVQLGILAMALGDPERALRGVEAGLMRDPFHYELLTLAGYASEQLGRLQDAVRYYERAHESQKADEKLLNALAAVYEKLGELDKAEAIRKEIRQ